jgi:hypothetical protein
MHAHTYRAAALMMLKKFDDALADCTLVVYMYMYVCILIFKVVVLRICSQTYTHVTCIHTRAELLR